VYIVCISSMTKSATETYRHGEKGQVPFLNINRRDDNDLKKVPDPMELWNRAKGEIVV